MKNASYSPAQLTNEKGNLYIKNSKSQLSNSTENMPFLLLTPPSNNVEFQKKIAKHTGDCYVIRQKTIRKLSNF